MTYTLEIELPIYKTDSNRILGVNRFLKAKIMKTVKQHVILACHGKKPEHPLKKFNLTTIRYGKKRLDDDNCHAMFKPYIDGLKDAGIIYNDSWAYINPTNTHRDQILSPVERVVIKIEETP